MTTVKGQPISTDYIKTQIRDLPALPAIVMELITSLGNDALTSEDLATKLSRDPALTAKTLRMANSSFYGMTRQIESVPEALSILGLRTVRTVVLAAGIRGNLNPARTGNFAFKAFWRHAVGAALCGQALARTLRMDVDTCFLVGLLHDIGALALAIAAPDRYDEVLAYQRQNDTLLIEAEDAMIGINHAQVGALLAEHWCFSPTIVEAISNHHHPTPGQAPSMAVLAHFSDALAHALGLTGEPDELAPPVPLDIWPMLKLDSDAYLALFADVEERFDAVCTALSV